jgi:hypothetical protein
MKLIIVSDKEGRILSTAMQHVELSAPVLQQSGWLPRLFSRFSSDKSAPEPISVVDFGIIPEPEQFITTVELPPTLQKTALADSSV